MDLSLKINIIKVPTRSRDIDAPSCNNCTIIFDDSVELDNRAAIKLSLDQTKFYGKMDEESGKYIQYMCRISWFNYNRIGRIPQGQRAPNGGNYIGEKTGESRKFRTLPKLPINPRTLKTK